MVDILTWMHNIGIAILTILISVAIFIIQDKRRLDWDELVILDKVIEVKVLMLSLFYIFIPVLFWEVKAEWIHPKVAIITLFLAGLGAALKILFNSYRWIRTIEIEDLPTRGSYRSRLRFECLREIKDFEEKKKIWALTWGREIKDLSEELTLLDVFLGELQQLQGKDLKGFHTLLRIFLNQLDKRKIADWRVFDALFPKLLEWHQIISGERYAPKEPMPKDFGLILETQNLLSGLFKQCVIEALKGRCAYPLFESLKKHIVPLSEKISKAKDQQIEKYLGSLFSTFCHVFFENIGLSPESDDIWREFFPSNWKVTTSNLKESFIARIWWGEFWRWGRERIVNVKSDYDPILEDVCRELFPKTDPIYWADILRFLFTPWVNDERVGSILKTKSNFGFVGRVSVSDNADWTSKIDLSKLSAPDKALFTDTIDLALLIGGDNFSIVNLEKYLKDLESYKDNPHAANFRDLFEAMMQKLSKRSTK